MSKNEKMICRYRRFERMPLLFAPTRQELVNADRIDHRARQDMRTDFAALFQHDDREFRIDLFEPDGSGQTRGSSSHDHDIKLHALALWKFGCLAHHFLLSMHAPQTRLFPCFSDL